MKRFALLAVAVLLLICPLFGADAYGAAPTYATGTLLKVDLTKKTITVQFSGKRTTMRTYGVNQKTALTINTYPAALEAFKPGLKVTTAAVGSQLASLKGWSTTTTKNGAAASEPRTAIGAVSQIDGNQIWVKLDNSYGEIKPFTVTSSTVVLKNGVKRDMRALLAGDRVKLYVSSSSSNGAIQKLEIQDDSISVTALYKGKLQRFDQKTGKMVMTDVQVFKDAQWQPYRALFSVSFGGTDFTAYSGAQKLTPPELASYKDSNIMVATKTFSNREQAERVIVESRHERTYSEAVQDYNLNTKELKLSGNQKFLIHPGTILIRNGRFIDNYGLEGAGHAFVSADAGYQSPPLLANIVFVYNEGMEKAQLHSDAIYWGTLDTILNGKLWLKDYYTVANHRWEFQYNSVRQLNYDNETVLLDWTNGIVINPNEFDRKNYAVDESDPYAIYHGLRDWFAYVYTSGDRLVQVGMWRYPDNLASQIVSIGIVDTLSGSNMSMKDAKDWSVSRTDWFPTGSSISLDLSKAVIMKDGATAQISDIRPDNNIYVIRDGGRALVVIVT
jgi:hypothetical protein